MPPKRRPRQQQASADDAGQRPEAAPAAVRGPGPVSNLFGAVMRNCADEVQALVDAGGSVNAQNDEGETPLHVAASHNSSDAARVLLKAGANVNATGGDGSTPLQVAAQLKHPSMIRQLAEAGASVDVKDKFGETPLIAVVRVAYLDVAKELLRAGASVDVKDSCRATPLFTAVARGRVEMARLLIEAGASVQWRHDLGWTVLEASSRLTNPAMMRLLLEAGASVDELDNAGIPLLHNVLLHRRNTEFVHLLLDAGAPVDVKNSVGQTPLMAAASVGNLRATNILVRASIEANVSLDETDQKGCTALYFAVQDVQEEHVGVVHLLLAAGCCCVNWVDESGNGPLHNAADKGSVPIVRALLEAGADLSMRDMIDMLPLQRAAFAGHLETVLLLREFGASTAEASDEGLSPFWDADGGEVRLLLRTELADETIVIV